MSKDAWDILQERMDRKPKFNLLCKLFGHKHKYVELGAGSASVIEFWECERCKAVL